VSAATAARIHIQKGRRRLISSTSCGGGSTTLHHYNRGMSTSSSAIRPRRAELCRPAAAADAVCGIDCGTAPAEHPHRRPRRYALHTRLTHTHIYTQTHTHKHLYTHTLTRDRARTQTQTRTLTRHTLTPHADVLCCTQ
jgi:hypothetical protein